MKSPTISTGAAAWLIAILGNLPQAAGTPEKPHIVFVLADDLGYGDVQCYNPRHGKIATPHIDQLASQGMRFTDAHSASSVCTPTRYSVLTGRYAWRTHLQSGVLLGFGPPLIAADRTTVASLLQTVGYQTAAIGKWHLGLNWQELDDANRDASRDRERLNQNNGKTVDWAQPILNGPKSLGFDYFYGISASLDMPPYLFIENDRVTALPTTEKKWIRSGPATEDFEAEDVMPVLTRKAVAWIEENASGEKPLFLYLAYSAPHTPILPTRPWQGKSGLNAYGDFVMQTDAAFGELLAALERTGLANNTLVIFTSDNGCSPAAKISELMAKGHNPSGPWRGHKADLWEGGHRVPFVARWPGRIAPGVTSAETVCLGDLLATVAALVGAEPPDHVGEDSVNILPALLGEEKEKPAREAIVHHSIDGRFAIRQGPWKLLLCPGSGGWSHPNDTAAVKEGLPGVQLYHLVDDPAESNNLQAVHPEIVARLTNLLERYVADGRSTPGKKQANDASVAIFKVR